LGPHLTRADLREPIDIAAFVSCSVSPPREAVMRQNFQPKPKVEPARKPAQAAQARTKPPATDAAQKGTRSQAPAPVGRGYAQQAAAVRPAGPKPRASLPGGRGPSLGGAEDVGGPMGRVFNRILGVDEGRTDTGAMSFTRDQLKAYLDGKLALAEGEWFRGKKLDGVADKMMEMLDKDKDGQVSWPEFQVFEDQIAAALAPAAKPGDTPEQVATAAGQQFDSMDAGPKDGQLAFGEIQDASMKALPPNTDHADLIAQLGARIALDAGDKDERGAAVKDRKLSRQEWTGAASEIAARKQMQR